MTRLLHITERDTWEAARPTGWYRMSTRGVSLDQQGFIHCSLPHQLRTVAEFVYGDGDEDLVVLVIDSELLGVPLKYEAPEPGADEFPHIYGPVPVGAVTGVVPVERDAEGRMLLPE
ncbi:DUF952 domain-containing protein [Actinoplanes sp. NPDC020271]|uniref:DUF952 domain-containing protein n=1 Tax=Actinoplanes sp. NPDC020271 TaxID=3363896 RepID=UPI0037BDF4B5